MSAATVLLPAAALTTAAGIAISTLMAGRRSRAVAQRVQGTGGVAVRRLAVAPSALLPSRDGGAPPLTHLLDGLGLKQKAELLLDSSGLSWGVSGLARASAACFIAACAAVVILVGRQHALAGLGAGAVAAWLPVVYAQRQVRLRVARFEDQFPDFLQFVSRSMRAGHAFSAALGMAYKEFSPPIATEFRRAFEESNLGQPMDTVLLKLAQRVPSLDVRFFASAVLLHKRTGGNLAELLDKLATLMRERSKLRAKIRALTAQGMMTGRILVAIPGIVAGLMASINPSQFRVFTSDPAGQALLAASVVMQVVGYLIIRHMVNMEV